MGGTAAGPEPPDPAARAFDASFEAHHAAILVFALRRVDDRAAAEDIVSETFAVAWRRRDDVSDPELPWLYAIAARVIANQARGSRRRLRLGARLRSEPSTAGRDPAEVVDEREGVLAALAALPERQQEVLRLVAWEGLEPRDAASVVGCSVAAFRIRLHRARRALAKLLAEAGHELDGRPVTSTGPAASKETR